jgi:N6-L-threonylcarbamoyladenine synthase
MLFLTLVLGFIVLPSMFTLRTFLNRIELGSGYRWVSALGSGGKVRDGIGKPKGYADARLRYILDKEAGALSGLPDMTKPFLVLGIETSCDDTGVAVVSSDGRVLSNVVYSQYEMHERFGGIVPGIAMQTHKDNIEKAIAEAVAAAGLQGVHQVDAIAVTKGPGLEICLRVGLRKAQEIARQFQKPLVTVHHLEAHCLIARLAGTRVTGEEDRSSNDEGERVDTIIAVESVHGTKRVEFPFLTLLASGGHTSLLICRGLGDYDVLGGTLDDALGEAFDKAARLMGLRTGGSGGAAVEAQAMAGRIRTDLLKVPMRDRMDCDFSYAGLKNQFRLAVEMVRAENGLNQNGTNAPAESMKEVTETVELPAQAASDLCATFQDVAFSHVEDRIRRGIEYIESNGINVDTLVVVGGVAANRELRRRLLLLLVDKRNQSGAYRKDKFPSNSNTKNWKLVFPPVSLCTDNGVMAAWAGVEKLEMGLSDHLEEQEVIARWPLGSILQSEAKDRATVFAKKK